MKTRFAQIAFPLALTLVVTTSLARAQAPVPPPAHLDRGQLLVDQIVAAQQAGIFADASGTLLNRYGGSWNSASDPSFIRFLDAAANIRPGNNTTCAPLVTHLLKYAYNFSWSKAAYAFTDPITGVSTTTASPSPYRYVALMKQRKGFPDGPVANLAQVRPGYVFSIWEPALAQQDHDHAGLVVSVAAQGIAYPVHANADPALTGTMLVPVTILDSTSSPHGAGDTRNFTYNNVAYSLPGAGTGVIGVLVDTQGNILGHTWSLPPADVAAAPATWLSQFAGRYHGQAERELLFARHEKQAAN